MPSLPASSFDPHYPHRVPLAATLRHRARELLAVAVAATAGTLVALRLADVSVFDVALAAHAESATVLPVERPLARATVAVEAAGTVGLLSSVVAAALLAARDHSRVRLNDGRAAFGLAAIAGIAGALVGHAVGVELVRDLVASGYVREGGAGGRYWLAELAVCLPVVAGAAGSTPAAVVGAARSNLVSRRWNHDDRGVSVLVAVTLAAVYSPPDSVTFVVAAGLLLASLAVGVALVEFDLA
ncbi:MAG: twin-arginine translocase subunit TatC [Haloferacaceae archaeon]